MAFAIMRTAKLKGGSVAASDLHTDRLRETKNADPNLTPENIYIVGERGMSLREKVDETIKAAGITKRKNAVECVEFFLGASPEYFEGDNKLTKTVAFVRRAKEFMDLQEEKGMVFVKAAVHLDETTPHIVAYAVPFDEKGKLNARAHLGGREKLSQLQDEYALVMEPLELERGMRGSLAEHQTIKQYYGKLEAMERLELEREQALQNQQRAQEMLERTHQLLERELERGAEMKAQKETDIPLRDAVQAFAKNTFDTSQGLVILKRDDPAEVRAIVTADNRAFLLDGTNLSNGSSVMMMTKLTGTDPEKVMTAFAKQFGAEQATAAAKAYGEELAQTAWQNERSLGINNESTPGQAAGQMQRQTPGRSGNDHQERQISGDNESDKKQSQESKRDTGTSFDSEQVKREVTAKVEADKKLELQKQQTIERNFGGMSR